jgi:hypothetical protein
MRRTVGLLILMIVGLVMLAKVRQRDDAPVPAPADVAGDVSSR